jgi:hypothetical protein
MQAIAQEKSGEQPAQAPEAKSESPQTDPEKTEEPTKKDGENDPTRGWYAGWLRLEGVGMTAWHSGRHDRNGDLGLRLTLDYEIPVVNHFTISPRVMPLMYYDENNEGDNQIFAAGFGFTMRAYVRKTDYRGFYAELGGMGIFQTCTFEGNDGWFNFMEEVGVGWVFKSDWNTSLKVGHISNADIFDENAGVNFATLGVGYSFGR